MIIKEYTIKIEVHQDKTYVHLLKYRSDEVVGICHEEHAKDLIPHLIREFDIAEEEERQKLQRKKDIFSLIKPFTDQMNKRQAEEKNHRKPMATRLKVVK